MSETSDQTATAGRVRRLLVESPGSLGARARERRWKLTLKLFPDLPDMNVIDIGGTVDAWKRAPVRPRAVTVLNLFEPGEPEEAWIAAVLGDACDATNALAGAGLPTSYDLAFSNSLLEHVGGHARREELAGEIRRLAPRHWVQTPYRYFPVEPHWLFPAMQFLPIPARRVIANRWPLSHSRPATSAEALSSVQWTELVGVTELRSYFPESRIIRERFAGLPKSIVAVLN